MENVLCTCVNPAEKPDAAGERYISWKKNDPTVHVTGAPVLDGNTVCYRISRDIAELTVCLNSLCEVDLPEMGIVWKPGMHITLRLRAGNGYGLRNVLEQVGLPETLNAEKAWLAIQKEAEWAVKLALQEENPRPMAWKDWLLVQQQIAASLEKVIGMLLYRNGLELSDHIVLGPFPVPA